MKRTDGWVVITGIIAITILEAIALLNGINGIVFTTVIAVIAGAIGYQIPIWRTNATRRK